MLRRLSLVLVACLTIPAPAQLTKPERDGLQDALSLGNLTVDDLGYQKEATQDRYRLAINTEILDHPITGIDSLLELHSKARGSLADLLDAGGHAVFGDEVERGGAVPSKGTLPLTVPEPMRVPITYLLACIGQANDHIRDGLKSLSNKERRELIEGLPQWACSSPGIQYDFVKSKAPEPARMLALLERVDLAEIRQAGLRLARQVDGVLPAFRNLSHTVSLKGTMRFPNAGLMVELSGQGDDSHESKDTSLCIDLGGKNHYTGRYGAGVGYASVLIDCGQSTYDVPDLSIGAGILGVGLVYELGTAPAARGQALCFGAGLAGLGAMYVDGGDAHFKSSVLSQGFGMFGCGALVAGGADNVFEALQFSQGSARTQGLGWLVTQKGGNELRCPGIASGTTLKLSCSQGFAEGLMSGSSFASGGVGLLTGLGMNDLVRGEELCQASAINGGVGSMALAEKPTCIGGGRCQGFARRESGALLAASGGSGTFTVGKGACHGYGDDYAVAAVVAGGGHDVFASTSGDTAVGLNQGLGFALLDGPENSISGFPGQGLPRAGVDSLGVFCQVDGTCATAARSRNVARAAGGFGMALIQGGDLAVNGSGSSDPPSASGLSAAELIKQSHSPDVFAARRAVGEMQGLNDPALAEVAATLLTSRDVLIRRAALNVLAKYPSPALLAADALLSLNDVSSKRLGVRLLGMVGTPEAMSHVAEILKSASGGVAVEALEVLEGRMPPTLKDRVKELSRSFEPLVRAVASGMDLG